jgi:N-formylglutamate amidohydrolase
VPRRLAGLGEVWRGRLPAAELQAQIEDVHAPYHAALAGVLSPWRATGGCTDDRSAFHAAFAGPG